MRPDELERKRAVEAGGSVVANVRKINTPYQRSPWFNPAKGRKTDHEQAVTYTAVIS
jgi:hypothetical protein